MTLVEINPGRTGVADTIVGDKNTAIAMGSGNVKVFATPAMIALMEAAAVEAIREYLPEGSTSVGIAVNIRHRAASGIGKNIHASAEVVSVNGKRIQFRVEAWDGSTLIGDGSHERVIVEIERFLSNLDE